MNLRLFFLTFLTLITLLEPVAEAKRRRHRSSRDHSRHARKEKPVNIHTEELCPDGEHALRTRLTNYYTPILSTVKCKDGRLGLMNYNKKEKSGDACNADTMKYVVKRMEGAGTILSPLGQFSGVLVSPAGPIKEIRNTGVRFSETLPIGSPEGMYHVAELQCPVGYGSKYNGEPVCLDPFRIIACPPDRAVGEVAFIPATVGITYPRYPGQPKSEYDQLPPIDGYFICGDIGDMVLGKHEGLFSAFINPYSSTPNPFRKFGSTRKYGICWVPKKENDRENRFKYHEARDINPQFPYLDPWTLANYTNQVFLAEAFKLQWRKSD